MSDLFSAAYSNDVVALRKALEEGADPNQQSPQSGTIPLQLACQGNALDAIKLLLLAGADPNRKYSRVSRVDGRRLDDHFPLLYVESREAVELLVRAGAIVDMTDGSGRTAIERAVKLGKADVFEALLQHSDTDATSRSKLVQRLMKLVDQELVELRERAGPTPNDYALNSLNQLMKIRKILESA